VRHALCSDITTGAGRVPRSRFLFAANFKLSTFNFQLVILDLLLVLMILIWGVNFSVVKVAMRDFPELAFNAVRLIIGSSIFVAAIWWTRRRGAPVVRTISRNDWLRLIALGVVGHFLYQLLFLGGIKRTSVGNGSLIVGSSPVVIALLSALAGHERVTPLRWLGVILALGGLYLVVGHRVDWSIESRIGDALMLGSLLCWATYSVGAQPLLRRHSPLIVTGVSMSIGAVLYAAFALPVLTSVRWNEISPLSWWLMIGSATLALSVAYLIWYTALQRIGSTRTSVYSYLTPVVAMVVAAIWLGEPISANQAFGAATILTGLVVTRIAPHPSAARPEGRGGT
jgi:drug/metabolite transporter (DMT)-like permease